MDEMRKEFEALMSKPPYEQDLRRNRAESAWPGNYRSYPVQLAWCAWQELWNRRANPLLISEQISSLVDVAWQVCNGWSSCDLYRDKKTAEGDSYRLQKRADLSGNLMAYRVEPLVRRTDAEAIIAGLQARIAELDKRERSAINMLHAEEDKVVSAKARIAELEAGIEQGECESCGETVPSCRLNHENMSGGAMCDDCAIASWRDRAHAISMSVMSDNAYHEHFSPQPTDRNAVIEECVSEILSKGESEIAPAAFFAHALRALKTNAKFNGGL